MLLISLFCAHYYTPEFQQSDDSLILDLDNFYLTVVPTDTRNVVKFVYKQAVLLTISTKTMNNM